MNAFKKMFCIVMAIILLSTTVVGCGNNGEPELKNYTISVQTDSNGTIVADKQVVEEGGDVTFTVTPKENYYLSNFTINDKVIEVKNNTFTYCDVKKNLSVSGVFEFALVEVSFDTKTEQEVDDRTYVIGNKYNNLPILESSELKTFVGWSYNGEMVTPSTIVSVKTKHTLVAEWREISEPEKLKRTPYSITVSYYDVNALSLGVSFHTEEQPFTPVIQISNGAEFDKNNCTTIEATTRHWEVSYISQAVIGTDILEYGKTYSYRIGDASLDLWSQVFTTTTREDTDSTSFLFVADTQQKYANSYYPQEKGGWAAIMEESSLRHDYDFIVHGGDIVNYGGEELSWKEMLGDVEQWLGKYPMVAVLGNHEGKHYVDTITDLFESMFNVSYPEQDKAGWGAYYSLDIGAMHLIVLRSNDFDNSDRKLSAEQLNWLREDLSKANDNPKIKWKIAVMHEGIVVPRSHKWTGTVHMDTAGREIMQVFREGQLDLALNGHSHISYISYPLDYREETDVDLDGDEYYEYVKNVKSAKHLVSGDENNLYDEDIYEFTGYRSGVDGTIFHEVGVSGLEYDQSALPLQNEAENKIKWVYFDRLMTTKHQTNENAYANIEGLNPNISALKDYSLYDYIVIDNQSITIKNYLFNYNDWINSKTPAIFNYGYKITK